VPASRFSVFLLHYVPQEVACIDGFSWNMHKREEKLAWAGEVWMGEWQTVNGLRIPASSSWINHANAYSRVHIEIT
jgi:hypothetical protein